MKKIWGMVTILGMTVCLLAGCGNDKKAAQDGSTNVENETAMENGTGSGSVSVSGIPTIMICCRLKPVTFMH